MVVAQDLPLVLVVLRVAQEPVLVLLVDQQQAVVVVQVLPAFRPEL